MSYDPVSMGAQCATCPLHDRIVVPPEGPAGPLGVLCGEGPGPRETEKRRPFVGPTGRRLDGLLRDAGIERAYLWVTNATLCEPITKSEKELRAATQCCLPRLLRELAALPVWIPVLAMGAWAMRALTDAGWKAKIDNERGFVRPLRRDQ